MMNSSSEEILFKYVKEHFTDSVLCLQTTILYSEILTDSGQHPDADKFMINPHSWSRVVNNVQGLF